MHKSIIRKLTINLLTVLFVCLKPSFSNFIFFKILCKKRGILQDLSNNFLETNKIAMLKFISEFDILSFEDSAKYKVKILDEERFENVRTPHIYGISELNSVNLKKNEIAIYRFKDAKICGLSDAIKVGEKEVFWEKVHDKTFTQVNPLDENFVAVDLKSQKLYLKESKIIKIHTVFFR